ncbi:hypothetical protein LJR039_002148 [Pseudorhodoferax sp. LjRoot39]|uniref:biotin/lipoyl-containing protein n=1 Tax=Pseudorhodoferax sp. LjRoot39 TaxID=3342328 RepID=UPI003ECCE1B4
MLAADITRLVRHLDRRGMASIALDLPGLSLRVALAPPQPAPALQPVAVATLPAAAPPAEPMAVRARATGLWRGAHPLRPQERCAPGQQLAAGQAIGLLQVGCAYLAVTTPVAGTVQAVLVQDGARVDYGMPLLYLKATP